MNKLLKSQSLAIALSLSSAAALAVQSVELPAMVVKSNSSFNMDTPLNITHLDQQDLQRSGQRELTQVLRATPSLDMPQGMLGRPAPVNLRGASGGMGLINIDGIPLHESFPGQINLDLFPAETFGSSDIRRGSSAMLDFGRTLGGRINLHSRTSYKPGASLHVDGGTFGTLRETATADFGDTEQGLNLTAGRDDVFDGSYWADSKQGNTERDSFHAHQLALHLNNKLTERLKLDSSLYYVNSDTGIDKTGLIHFPRPPVEVATIDDPGRGKQEIWLTQSTAGIDLHPKWHSELQLGFTQHSVNATTGGLLPSSPPVLIGFENQLSLARWKNSHSFELDGSQKRGIQFNWGGEGLYEQGHNRIGTGGQRGTGSGFANLQGDWDDWQSTLAVRADHFDDYGAHAVYHAGVNWRMTHQLHWFVSGGTGYRAPSFNELLMAPFGNSILKPEQSIGGEGGLRWLPNEDTKLSVNILDSHYDNLIKVERLALPLLGYYQNINIPHAQLQGLETQWTTHWNHQLTTGIDYTWTDSKNSDTDKPLSGQPKHIAKLWGEWNWQTIPLKLWAQGIYRGESYATEGTALISDSFHLNMQLSYQLNKPLSLYVRGENLTDNRQSQIIGWDMPGAAVYGGFKWVIW